MTIDETTATGGVRQAGLRRLALRCAAIGLAAAAVAAAGGCQGEREESATAQPAPQPAGETDAEDMRGGEGGAETADSAEGSTPRAGEAAEDAGSSNADSDGNTDAGEGYPGVVRIGSEEVPAKPAGAVRLVAYNVLNLFDDIDDPELTGSVDDMFDRRAGQRAKPESQRRAVAKAIRELDADIVALQEIEGLGALTEFRDEFLSGMGYEYIASEDVGYARGVEQSVLSRYPIIETETWPGMLLEGYHPDDPSRMSPWDRDSAGTQIDFRRSPLFVRISIPSPDDPGDPVGPAPDYDLGLFVIHHKSGRDNDYWREAEARGITRLINELSEREPDLNIAALGDFNATPGAESVEMYETLAGMEDAMAGAGVAGTRASWTHASQRTIDLILVNEEMKPELIEGHAFVYGTPLRYAEMDWRTTPPPNDYASDHMPVVVDFVPDDR